MQHRRGLFILLIWSFLLVEAQDEVLPETKSYTTTRLQGEIVIDGKLDDEAWNLVEWGGRFCRPYA